MACAPETRTGGVGAILYNENGARLAAFEPAVPTWLMEELFLSSANAIYELEIFPVLLAFRAWGRVLAFAQTAAYLENGAAK